MTAQCGIGITGHQARPGIDWGWVAERIRSILQEHSPVSRAFSSLAAGSDQVFASEALALGIPVTAIIPMPGYEHRFTEGLESYLALLPRCEQVLLDGHGSDQEAFMEAGRRVADRALTLVAVWDGEPAAGHGGTADVVAYALGQGRCVIQVDPIEQTVRQLETTRNSGGIFG